MSLFVCPECGATELHEKEVGLEITRELSAIDEEHFHTIARDYWVSEEGRKWWECGNCGWRLPASNVESLITYLQARKNERDRKGVN